MTTPVYICTGFLNSGKTTFIQDTLLNQDWIEEGPTLLIRCEEGEEEYSEKYLDAHQLFMVDVEDMDDLDQTFFEKCEKIYHPVQVIIEFNGMWDLQEVMDADYPKHWEIQGVYSTVNGETLDMYLKNMRNILLNQLVESELIVVNRCTENTNRSAFRRSMKMQNPIGQVLFEDVDGNIIPETEEDLPYDLKEKHIELEDLDYGIWFIDAYEHPERYVGKELSFLAQIMRPQNMPNNMIVAGRQIMTCCADDIQFGAYPAYLPGEARIEQKSWVRIKVRFEHKRVQKFGQKQPVLYVLDLKLAEKPEEEIVYIN